MAWTDNQGNTKKTILEHDIAKIDTFKFGCYCFLFGAMTDIDRNSILIKTQYYFDNGGFRAAEIMAAECRGRIEELDTAVEARRLQATAVQAVQIELF